MRARNRSTFRKLKAIENRIAFREAMIAKYTEELKDLRKEWVELENRDTWSRISKKRYAAKHYVNKQSS